MESDGASVAGPLPYPGDNESTPGMSLVPAECGLQPERPDYLNPMVESHVLQGVEEVKK